MLPTDLKLLRALYDQHLFNIFCNLIKELPEVDFNCFLNNFGIFFIRVLKMNKTSTHSTWDDKFSGKLTLTKKFKKFIYPNVISTYLIRKKVSLIIYSYFFLNSIMRI